METTIVYWSSNGIMENKMETTVVYWGYNGIMENKMETTIVMILAVNLSPVVLPVNGFRY